MDLKDPTLENQSFYNNPQGRGVSAQNPRGRKDISRRRRLGELWRGERHLKETSFGIKP